MRMANLLSSAVIALAPLSASAVTVTIDDVLLVDELGYECVPEHRIEEAFALGKSVRLPRTCLPEPCARALDVDELGQLIGREPTRVEWDEYYSRYAEYCRAEVTPFSSDDPPGQAVGSPAEFWEPIVEPPQWVFPLLPVPVAPPSTPVFVPTTGTPWTPTTTTFTPDPWTPFDPTTPTTTVVITPDVPEVAAVPLPAGAVLMLSALGLLAIGGRYGTIRD